MKISNSTYDILKWVALIVLPALAVMISALGEVWGIANAEAISTTINIVSVFVGTSLGFSTYEYNKGDKNE
ncbi:holin [Suicoccus acidiformans]|uniref:Holin n=1 Tax=Suicoccus acidiformans TaxID=2036206 RepID=A0A347WIJ0_9LACT|nr:phage holin [Suicoccus acidiformans]AXY24897.1 holin [Suicoccus acidiformans]